jgi:hypothetical protein
MPHPEQDVFAVPAPDAAAEQRRHARRVCLVGDVLRLAVRPTFGGSRALLIDVSAGGLGFLSGRPLDEGTVLALEVGDAEGAGARSLLARVVYAHPHPAPADPPWRPRRSAAARFFRGLFGRTDGAGREVQPAWFIGCQFVRPLAEDELRDVLRWVHAAQPSEPEA